MSEQAGDLSSEDGEWAGEFDPLVDPDERRVLFAALDSFRQYRRVAHRNITHRRRQSFYALPSPHWQKLSKEPFSILDTLNKVDDAIDANADIADIILNTGLEAFGLPINPKKGSSKDWHNTATSADVSKANSTIRQFYRDWSSKGSHERDVCYGPVLRDLEEHFGKVPASETRVLVPGAGLGRLVFELSMAGFASEGNEISYHQLLASSWLLNRTRKKEEYALYPFALHFSNLKSRKQQLQKVMIPDIHPGTAVGGQQEEEEEKKEELPQLRQPNSKPEKLEEKNDNDDNHEHKQEQEQGKEETNTTMMGSMSMSAADFLVLYNDPPNKDAFDAIATVFFIDTAPNLIRYIEAIHNCLKPGGIWINVGPLLWHFEDGTQDNDGRPSSGDHTASSLSEEEIDKAHQGIAEPGGVEFTEEEVLILIESMGFTIQKQDAQQDRQECGYIQDQESMLQNMYRPSHWVVMKNR